MTVTEEELFVTSVLFVNVSNEMPVYKKVFADRILIPARATQVTRCKSEATELIWVVRRFKMEKSDAKVYVLTSASTETFILNNHCLPTIKR